MFESLLFIKGMVNYFSIINTLSINQSMSLHQLMNIRNIIFIFMLGLLSGKSIASSEMNFHIYRPCNGNGSMCSSYIFANGEITRNTPIQFEKFLQKNKGELFSPAIYFNSIGGDLLAGVGLAKIIRNNKLNTHIGKIIAFDYNFTQREAEDGYKVINDKSVCYSACAYAFLGGVTREIDWDNGSYGVHQFYSNGKDDEDVTQTISSALAIFLDNMGVDRKLLDIASFTKKDDIFLLSEKISRELGVENHGEAMGSWIIETKDNGDLFTCSSVKQEDNQSYSMLCFTNKNNSLIASIIYYPSTQYPIEDIASRFNDENDGFFPISIEIGSHRVSTKKETMWGKTEKGFIKNFLVSAEIIAVLTLAPEESFIINIPFSQANRHIDPSATFTTDNLSGALKALLRQNQ